MLKELLIEDGFDVIMTREEDGLYMKKEPKDIQTKKAGFAKT